MLFVFWFSLAFLAYTEVGYPLLLWLLSKFRSPRAVLPLPETLPRVTLLIAAHNEEQVIAAKLDNTLTLDYPKDRLQVIVASDGSTDGTNDIVRGFAERGITLYDSPVNRGKVPTIRGAEPLITGEVVLFSDADSMYEADVLREMVRPFGDAQVGAVSGHETRHAAGGGGKGAGEGLYSRIDNLVKHLEGEVGSQVMVNGGFFAIRRHLLPHVPDHLTHDGVVPPTLALRGYRTAYAPDAVSNETYALDSSQDWRRRIRTVLQAFQSYLYVKDALNPRRTGFYAVQIWSHRLFRWLVLPFMLLALVSNAALSRRSRLFKIAAGIQAIFYALAALGYVLDKRDRRPKAAYFPFYFLYVHAAAFRAIVMGLAGKRMATWTPTQRAPQAPED